MNILGDMGVSELSAKVFLKVNYSFKPHSKPAYVWLAMNRHRFGSKLE